MFDEKTLARFWSKVKIGLDNECWPWLANKNEEGRGRFNYKGKDVYAARFAWMTKHGEIPKDMCCCHICDNPNCVNFLHIFLSDQKGNVHDMINKGRYVGAKGNKHTPETIEKCKIAKKNFWKNINPEKKENMLSKLKIVNIGRKYTRKKFSTEAKQNMSKAAKKRWESIKLEENKTISSFKANQVVGRKLSEEHKQNIKKSWDARKLKASQS